MHDCLGRAIERPIVAASRGGQIAVEQRANTAVPDDEGVS